MSPCQVYIVFGKVFFCTKRYFPFSCVGLTYSLNNHYSSWLVSKTQKKQNKKNIYIFMFCVALYLDCPFDAIFPFAEQQSNQKLGRIEP